MLMCDRCYICILIMLRYVYGKYWQLLAMEIHHMTSPTNNQPRPDPRWEQAKAERKIGHKHDSKSRHSAYRVLDAIPNRQLGTTIEEGSKSFKEFRKARKHYSAANRLENDALRDACKEYKIECIIL